LVLAYFKLQTHRNGAQNNIQYLDENINYVKGIVQIFLDKSTDVAWTHTSNFKVNKYKTIKIILKI